MVSHLLSSALPLTPRTREEGCRGWSQAVSRLILHWRCKRITLLWAYENADFGEALAYSYIWIIFVEMSPHARVATQEASASRPKGLRLLLLRELVVRLILTQIKPCIFPSFVPRHCWLVSLKCWLKKPVSHQDRHHHEKFQPNWLIFNNVHMAC